MNDCQVSSEQVSMADGAGGWGTPSGSLEDTGLGQSRRKLESPPPPPLPSSVMLWGEVGRADAWGQIEERGAF